MENKNEEYSKMVLNNTILLSLEGWIKYVEGFTKGLQTTDKVRSSAVLDCVGEILEYMTQFKVDILKLFNYCEHILTENQQLKEQLKQYQEQENVALIPIKEEEEDE